MTTDKQRGKPRAAPKPSESGDHIVDPDAAQRYWQYLFGWQRKLGLQGWRIVKSPIEAKGSMAEMAKWNRTQRQVSARLGTNWKATPVTPINLERTAVHELLHVLLADVIALAKDPSTSQEDLDNAEHAVINTLETLLVPGEEG